MAEWLTHTHTTYMRSLEVSDSQKKIESRVGGPGVGEGMSHQCLMETVGVWEDEKALEPYSGDGCLALRMHVTPVTCALKIVMMVNVKLELLNAILPQFKIFLISWRFSDGDSAF